MTASCVNSPEPDNDRAASAQLPEESSTPHTLSDTASPPQLSASQLSSAQLSDGQLSDAQLSDAQMADEQLCDAQLSDTQLSASQLSPHHSTHHHQHTGVKDSLLAYRQTESSRDDCDGGHGDGMRLLSRDSNASAYSAFSLQGLQSPPLRLKSTDTISSSSRTAAAAAGGSGRIGSSMLDSLDPNLLLHLSGLQANQLEDLENVLLPHLTVDPRVTSSSVAPSPSLPAALVTVRASMGGSDNLLEQMADAGDTAQTAPTVEFVHSHVKDTASALY